MARSYTKVCAKAKDQFKADHYNREADGLLQQFNGQLDQNNMPINSVGPTHLIDPIRKSNEFGVFTNSSYMPTQSYHEATWTIANDTGTVRSAMPTPTAVYDANWDNGNINPYWNNFDYSKVTQGARIRFNAKEGMLYGGVTISVETREGEVSFQGQGGSTWGPEREGFENACEIGVFCNGILIARSGKIHCGAFTLDIPFGLPIGNEFCEIVVKWMHEQKTARDEASGTWDTADNDHFYRFVCAGISTWCRNQYR